MKRALVLLLTVGAVALITIVGLATSSRRALPTDALAKDSFARGELAPAAPPPALSAPAPEPVLEGRADKRRMELNQVFGGAGPGLAAASPKKMAMRKAEAELDDLKPQADDAPASNEAGGGQAATRAWFPETFLFEPLVVTDDKGQAHVPVKVPDRLTTWRVLALAHARDGSQAGAVTSFLGTLPAYVEPVVPPFLYAGDVVRLPIQVVNTTDERLTSSLSLTASGASIAASGGPLTVGAKSSELRTATLSTRTPGVAIVKSTLGSTDAVERRIDVRPAGQRVVQTKGGTLAQQRSFTLEGPVDALPGTEAVRIEVFPGALGLLRNELSAAPGRGGVAEDAYLLQLLGQAPALLRSLGTEPDAPVIRDLTVLATQRVMQHARAPSVDAASLLTEAALSHPDNPVLSRLGERLAMQLAAAQRPDGTCQGATGWTLQRLLVATSECVRAVRASSASDVAKQRAQLMSLKAAQAFERNMGRIADPYTAAAVLASGALPPGAGQPLEKLILDHLKKTDDGVTLELEAGVVRADGSAPSSAEGAALAILALQNVKEAPIAELGTTLLAGYSSWAGWGDGRANLVALRAATTLFKDPVPSSVSITLARDGKTLTEGTFDAQALKDVLRLSTEATGSGGKHEWTLTATPPVPGLGFALQLVAYRPWKDERRPGLELQVTMPEKVEVGHAAKLQLTAAMPANQPMTLRLGLPAAAQVDTDSLEALVNEGKMTRFEKEDGAVTVHLPGQNAGVTWSSTLTVIPTLGGALQAEPSSLFPEGQPERGTTFAPKTWTID